MLTVLSRSLTHLVNSYGYQCRRCEVYGSNTSRLVIAPISGGIRTRLVPYRTTRCLTSVSFAIVAGSVTICRRSAALNSTKGLKTGRPSAAASSINSSR